MIRIFNPQRNPTNFMFLIILIVEGFVTMRMIKAFIILHGLTRALPNRPTDR